MADASLKQRLDDSLTLRLDSSARLILIGAARVVVLCGSVRVAGALLRVGACADLVSSPSDSALVIEAADNATTTLTITSVRALRDGLDDYDTKASDFFPLRSWSRSVRGAVLAVCEGRNDGGGGGSVEVVADTNSCGASAKNMQKMTKKIAGKCKVSSRPALVNWDAREALAGVVRAAAAAAADGGPAPTTAIVGARGAGKSTLARALCNALLTMDVGGGGSVTMTVTTTSPKVSRGSTSTPGSLNTRPPALFR